VVIKPQWISNEEASNPTTASRVAPQLLLPDFPISVFHAYPPLALRELS